MGVAGKANHHSVVLVAATALAASDLPRRAVLFVAAKADDRDDLE